MNALKHRNLLAAYDGHHGPVTMAAVKAHIPAELWSRLTGRELGLVMSAVNSAYHAGRASKGQLDLVEDGDCTWLPWGGPDGRGQIVEVETFKSLDLSWRTQCVVVEA